MIMRYRFQDFELDLARRELTRAGCHIRIEPQVFELLAYLVANNERVVSKDELISVVWQGRIVSESAITTRINAARVAVGDAGNRQHLIKTVRGSGLRFIAPLKNDRDAVSTSRSIPSKVAITVRPFRQVGRFMGEFDLAKAVTEQLALRLHHSSWFCLTAQPVGARYALGGTVRLESSRQRASLHVLDLNSQLYVWADDVELSVVDPVEMEDDLAERVAERIIGALDRVEIERAFAETEDGFDERAICVRGKAHLLQWTEPDIADALSHFQRAIQCNPDFSPAYGWAAYCYVQRQSYGWFKESAKEIAEGVQFARQAARAGSQNPEVLAKAAHAIAALTGDYEAGADLIERALAVNRYSVAPHYVGGWIELFRGYPQSALEQWSEALRLGRQDPLRFKVYAGMSYAHFFKGHYELAIESSTHAIQMRPGYQTALRAAAASLAFAGRSMEAKQRMQSILRHNPTLRASHLSSVLAFSRQADSQKYADALQIAGLPD
jgi:DNA-binding winged helix-turn-helix (wHTH) protein/tetratricopeptide (TPR) repeat protein